MAKRTYVEVKLNRETLDRAKKRAIDEGISKAELISKAVEIYLRTPIDKHDKQA